MRYNETTFLSSLRCIFDLGINISLINLFFIFCRSFSLLLIQSAKRNSIVIHSNFFRSPSRIQYHHIHRIAAYRISNMISFPFCFDWIAVCLYFVDGHKLQRVCCIFNPFPRYSCTHCIMDPKFFSDFQQT